MCDALRRRVMHGTRRAAACPPLQLPHPASQHARECRRVMREQADHVQCRQATRARTSPPLPPPLQPKALCRAQRGSQTCCSAWAPPGLRPWVAPREGSSTNRGRLLAVPCSRTFATLRPARPSGDDPRQSIAVSSRGCVTRTAQPKTLAGWERSWELHPTPAGGRTTHRVCSASKFTSTGSDRGLCSSLQTGRQVAGAPSAGQPQRHTRDGVRGRFGGAACSDAPLLRCLVWHCSVCSSLHEERRDGAGSAAADAQSCKLRVRHETRAAEHHRAVDGWLAAALRCGAAGSTSQTLFSLRAALPTSQALTGGTPCPHQAALQTAPRPGQFG